MAWHQPGYKPWFEPMMVILPKHICVTRPQWVNRERKREITVCPLFHTKPLPKPNTHCLISKTHRVSSISFKKMLLKLSLPSCHHLDLGDNEIESKNGSETYGARASFLTSINTLRPRQKGQNFADNIFKHIFSYENCCILIKIALKFVTMTTFMLGHTFSNKKVGSESRKFIP